MTALLFWLFKFFVLTTLLLSFSVCVPISLSISLSFIYKRWFFPSFLHFIWFHYLIIFIFQYYLFVEKKIAQRKIISTLNLLQSIVFQPSTHRVNSFTNCQLQLIAPKMIFQDVAAEYIASIKCLHTWHFEFRLRSLSFSFSHFLSGFSLSADFCRHFSKKKNIFVWRLCQSNGCHFSHHSIWTNLIRSISHMRCT